MPKQHPIVILHNSYTPESPEDVLDSIRQAEWIGEILQKDGYSVSLLPFSIETLASQAKHILRQAAIVMNLVDSAPKEESLTYLVPGLLSFLQLPYTGCSMESLLLTTNKILTKTRLSAFNIATPEWIEIETVSTFVSGLYVVKPTEDDASVGIDEKSLIEATTKQDILEEMTRRQRKTGRPHYAEQYIDGREFTCCIYGAAKNPTIMDPYEWIFEGFEEQNLPKMFTFAAKWDDSCYAFDHIKACYQFDNSDKPLLQELKTITAHCWQACKLSGYARVDFRIDHQGKPWVLEINGNPSFYGFHHSAKAMGITFESVLETILETH